VAFRIADATPVSSIPAAGAAYGSGADTQVHIARQPIYDAHRRLVGYELLFRGDSGLQAAGRRGPYATSMVLLNAYTEFGLAELVGDGLCFLNLTGEFLSGDLPLPLVPGSAVLEVLESVTIDDRVISGLLKLVDAGFPLAVDDFVLGQPHEQLLSVSSYVKVNFATLTPDGAAAVVDRCRRYPDLKLVAERLETPADVRLARRLGFDLLQGYALARPETLTTRSQPLSRTRRLELFALTSPDVSTEQAVSVVATDQALGYRMVRAQAGDGGGPAAAPRAAAEELGLMRLRQWITLLLVTDVTENSDELLAAMMARARLCQRTAERLGQPGRGAFTAGLLVGVAEVLATDVSELIDGLPLPPALVDAIRSGAGPIGQVLSLVRSYEEAHGPVAEPAGGADGGAEAGPDGPEQAGGAGGELAAVGAGGR
jgi:c-di-GMP-related signal transduction protein